MEFSKIMDFLQNIMDNSTKSWTIRNNNHWKCGTSHGTVDKIKKKSRNKKHDNFEKVMENSENANESWTMRESHGNFEQVMGNSNQNHGNCEKSWKIRKVIAIAKNNKRKHPRYTNETLTRH